MITVDRTREVRKLLDYLAAKPWDWRYTVRKNGYKYSVSKLIRLRDEEARKRDELQVDIDFNTQEVSWSASFTSYHNGSSYGGITGKSNWDEVMEDAYPVLLERATEYVTSELKKEDDERRKQAQHRRVMRKLETIFEGE